MSKKNLKNVRNQTRQEKKQQFQSDAKEPPKRTTSVLGIAGIILIAAVGLYFFFGGTAGTQSLPATTNAAQDLRIPVSPFTDGQARFYKYTTPDAKEIRFFVVKSSDGVIRAAYDACDVCYKHRKGYRQQGDEMICNNCGQRFASVRINEVKGGCNPAPLARTVEGDFLIIKPGDLMQGTNYF